eukprot:m.326602 g.326602  ORF g.326602 m.326602 type:complete len:727 (-) comp16560_c0_seq7:253-2433(-)
MRQQNVLVVLLLLLGMTLLYLTHDATNTHTETQRAHMRAESHVNHHDDSSLIRQHKRKLAPETPAHHELVLKLKEREKTIEEAEGREAKLLAMVEELKKKDEKRRLDDDDEKDRLGGGGFELQKKVTELHEANRDLKKELKQAVAEKETHERLYSVLNLEKKELELKIKNLPAGDGNALVQGKDAPELHRNLADYILDQASPAEVSLLHRIKKHVKRFGLPATQTSLDELSGGKGTKRKFECSREAGQCKIGQANCAKDGKITVVYGASFEEKNVKKEFPISRSSISCTSYSFGKDPAPGTVKTCWIICESSEDEVQQLDSCSNNDPDGVREWAKIPLCGVKAGSSKEEAILQESIKGLCDDPVRKPGFDVWLDCRYRKAFAKAVHSNSDHVGPIELQKWMDRIYVTYFKGSPSGMAHSMMVSNLIRSVHLFSKEYILVFVVGQPTLSVDWDPEVFPRLIIIHANPLETMNHGDKVSFNFNKFRSMLLRIRSGVQLDADMINGPNCDLLFKATEKYITADYPYPIMPVHWMTRFKSADGYSTYAVQYPGDNPENKENWPPRLRWAHCHPTWTFYALPFVADALVCKLSYQEWKKIPRVIEGIGHVPEPNPQSYMSEDEDLLNILLWRYKATRQWCKWDVEPGLYERFLSQAPNDAMSDRKWYPNGVPLVFVSMHNTKETVQTDALLKRIVKQGAPDTYLHYKGKYFPGPEQLEKEFDMSNMGCLLV